MDPKNINKTGFCNDTTDNIISNDLKQYILTDMNNRTTIKHDTNYARLYNKKFINNFRNPHIFCFKTYGSPYLLFCTKINNVSYSILIDKKINKGHSLPKMFIVNYKFSNDIYNGSLFECELIRDNSNIWFLLIGDIYYLKNEIYKKNITIIDRLNNLYNVLDNDYTETEFSNICNIRVKKYFDVINYDDIINNYLNTLNYKVRGIYIIPININHANILYIYTEDNKKQLYSNKQNINFKVIRGTKPEIYDIYLKAPNGYQKIDTLYVKNIMFSHYMNDIFKDNSDIVLSCIFNDRFQKWEGVQITNENINHINDIK